MSSNLTLN